MRVYVRSDIGKVRSLNEDAYYTPEEGERFCAVADGMGGHNAGEIASSLAASTFAKAMGSEARWNGPALRRSVERANAAVYNESRRVNAYNGMGTTFTALSVYDGDVHIAHVGDSRAYMIRNGSIMRLTIDHTLVEELVLKGRITPREAKYHPKRNIITRALGTSDHVDVDLVQIELMPGDVFFLCTDGLSNHVEEQEILEISRREGSWEDRVCAVVDAALGDGGSDNITAMFITFDGEAQQ